jgi:hypothetical protein
VWGGSVGFVCGCIVAVEVKSSFRFIVLWGIKLTVDGVISVRFVFKVMSSFSRTGTKVYFGVCSDAWEFTLGFCVF